ncbi:peptide chain release factor N(5)-glutamine methyltransferase [Shimia marina]|uniref:Release factor glutamine methyltransferase n=1 Tax=Shimia marina TaxID=321267 RepID=A0A0P1FEB9_9RHOB|nr:peptide chain release factor N(5)-glutamine methyltransferase [Shimia marina]CUH53267.1 Release factor glutamine methyltransferase [Shimia marina]SFD81148.1 [protein release factor]-glutamine N5-methyltransferase [Shimia marina]
MSLTIAALIAQAVERLKSVGFEDPGREARLLVAKATEISAARLSLEAREAATEQQQSTLNSLLARRVAREPMSHIIGQRAFYKHDFKVTADTLDPRPETEALILAALERPFSRLLDLGTGTGAIAFSLLAERPTATGIATDLSQGALSVARENAVAVGVADRVELIQSDWYAHVSGTYDLIVSNPPYIALEEMPSLAPELSYEPRMALTDEADGLTAYRKIAAGAPAHLTSGGWLMVEIGWQQGTDVAALFEAAGLKNIAVLPDLDGRDRVVTGQNL